MARESCRRREQTCPAWGGGTDEGQVGTPGGMKDSRKVSPMSLLCALAHFSLRSNPGYTEACLHSGFLIFPTLSVLLMPPVCSLPHCTRKSRSTWMPLPQPQRPIRHHVLLHLTLQSVPPVPQSSSAGQSLIVQDIWVPW